MCGPFWRSKAVAKSRPLHLFTSERLERDRGLSPEAIATYLDDFGKLAAGDEGPRKLISLRVPERLLASFQAEAKRGGLAYQTQIVDLMRQWLVKKER